MDGFVGLAWALVAQPSGGGSGSGDPGSGGGGGDPPGDGLPSMGQIELPLAGESAVGSIMLVGVAVLLLAAGGLVGLRAARALVRWLVVCVSGRRA